MEGAVEEEGSEERGEGERSNGWWDGDGEGREG